MTCAVMVRRVRGTAGRWGFHRLAEPSARRLVEAAGIRRGDLVLDIGAGDGGLTRPLALDHGATLAIEAHPRRAGICELGSPAGP